MLWKLAEEVRLGQRSDYVIGQNRALMKHNRMCVPNVMSLKAAILKEAHISAFAMHPGSTKIYRTLKEHYWWPGMKREIVEYVGKCLIYQQVKLERQKPRGLLNPLPTP